MCSLQKHRFSPNCTRLHPTAVILASVVTSIGSTSSTTREHNIVSVRCGPPKTKELSKPVSPPGTQAGRGDITNKEPSDGVVFNVLLIPAFTHYESDLTRWSRMVTLAVPGFSSGTCGGKRCRLENSVIGSAPIYQNWFALAWRAPVVGGPRRTNSNLRHRVLSQCVKG